MVRGSAACRDTSRIPYSRSVPVEIGTSGDRDIGSSENQTQEFQKATATCGWLFYVSGESMRRIEAQMTKEEIIAAVKECAERLGHVPSATEFAKETRVNKNDLKKKFGSYRRRLFASGLEREGRGESGSEGGTVCWS